MSHIPPPGDDVPPHDEDNVPPPAPVRKHKRRSGGTGYLVRIQDPHGKVTTKRLLVRDVHNLPSEHRVEVDILGRTQQPTGQGGELFSRFCGNVGQNFRRFPIDPLEWRKIDEGLKNSAWSQIVKRKFLVSEVLKGWGISKMGDGWKSRRNEYFKDRNAGGSRPFEELVQDVPSGVPADAWARYVKWRRGEIGQRRSEKGVHARAHQTVLHTHGSKLFSVGYGEMAEEAAKEGKQVTLGQFYTIYHRHRDGTPISDAAEEQIAKIIEAETEINRSQEDNVDPTASLRAAFGQRGHPGRVRGLGFGALPSRVYGSISQVGQSQSFISSLRMPDPDYEERIRAQLREEMREQIREEMREQIREEMRDQMREEWEQLRAEKEQLKKEREEWEQLRVERGQLRNEREDERGQLGNEGEDMERRLHEMLGGWIQTANSALQELGVQLPLLPRPLKQRRLYSPRSEQDDH